MGVTYTHARERDDRRAVSTARRLASADLLLLCTSLVSLLAIGLAYAGQRQRVVLSAGSTDAVRTINLNEVADAPQFEHALEAVLTNPADRRFAARELFRFVTARRLSGQDLPNVEAILGATAPVRAIESTPRLEAYVARLRAAREHAAHAGGSPPAMLRILTSSDLAAIKPALVVRTQGKYAREILMWATLYVLGFYAMLLLWMVKGLPGDRVLLAAGHLLTALGFVALLTGADPLRDTLFFVRYTVGVLAGLAVMGALSLVDFRKTAFLRLSYIPLFVALFLSVVLLLFGRGPGASGAKVNLGPVQPIEAIRLLLALFLAGYFARRWELLRQIGGKSDSASRHARYVPDWLKRPRADYVMPVVAGVGAAVVFFFLQKDLGPALFLSCVFLVLYALARGRLPMAIAGFALLAAAFYVGYRLNISQTLAARVQMWQSPWDNPVRGGDQVAHAVWALATGGFFGTGLGLGETRYLPAGRTDLPLAAIGEELGFVGLLVILAAYAVMNWRGFRIGIAASSDYGFFLATAVTLFLVIPVLVMSAGMLGVIPLTGIVTPFLSYGGSAMTANFAALGILTAIQATGRSSETAEPFRKPVRYLSGALCAGAAGLVAVLLSVQVVNADEYLVKPQFSIQADGIGRYQYNPRVLNIVRRTPRGNVYDRSGLTLATEDRALAQRSREEYRRLGVTPNMTCLAPIERCYPLGGLAFHLLGESSTRLNWSATNASYVERDAEDRLRGFDDRSVTVRSTDHSGQSAFAVRRDYRELVPLLRHRYDPQHEAVQAFLGRDRDVRLTIDARLQVRVAKILASAVKSSATGKAAAVVLDPDTGDLLAVASYPWPALERDQEGGSRNAPGALLDRARYGLYPPGSIFKLVTAAAALRKDPGLSAQKFTCSPLADGRVGARIPGSRAVRDDVLDGRPHGTIDMHDGLVQSCNAYFAQLALGLGPEPMLDVAAMLGISVGSSDSSGLRATLPQAGYGQGEVVVTPLRMARVAAALASEGVLRDPRLEASPPTQENTLLPPDGARLLARYMRDAVLTGTGRTLARHPWRIAGKTGTAQVDQAASHSWFVGFAPYGPATKRVAFAVIIENAGYGSLAAAPVAGDIVTAAAAVGLVK
jgi:cell division protein FtsW (lipid II flippase)